MKKLGYALVATLSLACGAVDDGQPDESVASAEQAVTKTWIGPISDESWKSFKTCGSTDTGVTQAQCQGRYCDDVSLFCDALPSGTTRTFPNFYMEDWVSEEAPGQRMCDEDNDGVIDGVVVGMAASGSYSDNISLQCQRLSHPLGQNSCNWTGWFSEEQGLLDFGGRAAVGVGCSGSYCDNMRYFVCQF